MDYHIGLRATARLKSNMAQQTSLFHRMKQVLLVKAQMLQEE